MILFKFNRIVVLYHTLMRYKKCHRKLLFFKVFQSRFGVQDFHPPEADDVAVWFTLLLST